MALRTSIHKVVLNGLKMGFDAAAGDGAFIAVEDVSGLGGPASVFSTGQKVQANGIWATKGYLGGRTIGITGFVQADDPVTATAAADAIEQATSVDDVPCVFLRSDRAMYAMARRNGEVVIDWVDETQFDYQLVLMCTDPGMYLADPNTLGPVVAGSFILHLPQSTGGLVFPITFPITFDGSSSSGDASVTFGGGGGKCLSLRINGPVTNPQIIFQNPAGTFTLKWGIELLGSQFLAIDLDARTAKLNGQVNHPPSIRQWPTFPAGTTLIQFRADAYESAAYLGGTFLQYAK